jgi:hypothetical protein
MTGCILSLKQPKYDYSRCEYKHFNTQDKAERDFSKLSMLGYFFDEKELHFFGPLQEYSSVNATTLDETV